MPSKFTEASHQYSFGKANRIDEAKILKASIAPGPGAYEIVREEKMMGFVKPKDPNE